jgi:hypothetical protein
MEKSSGTIPNRLVYVGYDTNLKLSFSILNASVHRRILIVIGARNRGSLISGVAIRLNSFTGLAPDRVDMEDGMWNEQATDLEHSLRRCERRFFEDVPPVAGIEVVNADFPAKYLPERQVIQLDAGVARFPRLAGLLIVHELVHHKLHLLDPSHASDPCGPAYRAEIKALCNQDAYLNLL